MSICDIDMKKQKHTTCVISASQKWFSMIEMAHTWDLKSLDCSPALLGDSKSSWNDVKLMHKWNMCFQYLEMRFFRGLPEWFICTGKIVINYQVGGFPLNCQTMPNTNIYPFLCCWWTLKDWGHAPATQVSSNTLWSSNSLLWKPWFIYAWCTY